MSASDFANFDARYGALNAEQRQAVDALEGPVMVIAGPGTGKTEVLTMRIANILRRTSAGGVPKTAPERILALTFTESGAVSMRRRLVELIGRDAYRVEISTFHGFANRVIHDYPDYFPNIVGATNITEIEQVGLLQSIIDGASLKDLRPFGDRYYYLRDIQSAINELKQQGVAPAAFATIAEDAKKDFYENPDLINQSGKYEGKIKGKYASAAKRHDRNIELAAVYAEYQKALTAAHQYDYSDMIMYVALALENDPELAQILQTTYDYFLIDEHQDTNDAQNKIIEIVAGGTERPNLFVVGDEKQAIYRFQGASDENFHYFKNRYSGVTLIALCNNYRSTQGILDVAQAVSPREAALMAHAGHAGRAAGGAGAPTAHLAVFSSPDVEHYFIARKITELIQSGVPAEHIAVLYRTNKDVTPLVPVFEKLGVAFNIESNQDVLGDPEIKKLVRLLRAIQHFGNDVYLAEALHVDFLGIAPIDVYKLSVYAFRERRKMYEIMQYSKGLEMAGIDESAAAAYAKLFVRLSEWKRFSKNHGAAEAFEKIVYESGFIAELLKHPAATEKIAKLHALFDVIKSSIERDKNYTLENFFTYLDLMESHDISMRAKDTIITPGRVRLMTAHGSKGQEFDYVFVIGAADRKWGSRLRRETIKLPTKIYRGAVFAQASAEGDDEHDGEAASLTADERNVFYVAITRARKGLYITVSNVDQSSREQLPTQFIAGMPPTVLVPDDVSRYEKEYDEHREELSFMPASARTTKTPELEDKIFLNELFQSQGLSVTALNNYLECPWQYFYRNLVRIPEAPNKHLSFGNAIHAALKSYFDALAAGEEITKIGGKEYLVRRFEEEMAHQPIKESEYEEALAKGRRALPLFYDEYHSTWNPHGLNEVRIDGVSLKDGTPINGKLDRIEFLDATHGAPASIGATADARELVRVIDYKTGKPKTRNDIEGNIQSSSGDYKRQLVFYKLLLDKEARREMHRGIVQFIEPDDRGTMHREEFEVTPGEVKVLEAQAMQVAQEIRNLSFWDKGCNEPDCRYCELRRSLTASS